MSDCHEHKTRLVTHMGILRHRHFEQIFEEEMVEISLSVQLMRRLSNLIAHPHNKQEVCSM